MDTNDAEAGMLQARAAVGRETRGHCKLPALLLAHIVLTCACAALCVHTLHRANNTEANRGETPVPEDKGIYLNMLKVANYRDPKLNFTVTWNNSLKLEHGSEVKVFLPGPYVFYICAVVVGNNTKGNLTLAQGHTNTSIELPATSANRCVRHQRVVSLYEEDTVTFSFSNMDEPYLLLKDLRVGLHYMLGEQHFKTPD